MPPKKKGKGSNVKHSESDDEEFNKMLQELQKISGESHKKSDKKIITTEERKAIHRERSEAAKKDNSSKFDESIKQSVERVRQQQRMRQMFEMMMMQQRPYLSSPKTDVKTECKEGNSFTTGMAEMQGWRTNMEDAHTLLPEFNGMKSTGLFAVFDGHAGAQAAEIASRVLPDFLSKNYTEPVTEEHLVDLYSKLDVELRAKLQDKSATMGPGSTAGTTAVSVIVTKQQIVCASVGDSRAILCRGGNTIPLSFDHKPDDSEEKQRIIAANGTVENNRVNGSLAMSRALGDFGYKVNKDLPPEKQQVSCVPRVISETRCADDEFIVIACDGIFDVMSNEHVVSFVLQGQQKLAQPATAEDLAAIATEMTQACLAPGENDSPIRGEGTDNMTVMIVTFKK